MVKRESRDKTQELLLSSFNEITDILKGIGHPNRYKILILLFTGPKNFQTLIEEMKLKKSALANHLTHLMNRSLVEKIQHGTYKLTADGEGYLQALGETYRESVTRKKKITEARKRQEFARSFLERK